MELSKNVKIFLISLLIVSIFILIFAIYVYINIYSAASSDKSTQIFTIKSGSTLTEVANQLREEGLIRSPFIFRIYITLKGKAGTIQAGDYELSPSMTLAKIADVIMAGETKKVTITIPEGLNIREIAAYLEKEGVITAPEFTKEAENIKKYKEKYTFLAGIKSANMEGFLFPDTYYLSAKPDVEEIVDKMLENFNEKITSDIRAKAKKYDLSFYEFITLASIVEKESSNTTDQRIIAGIFYKRLQEGMRLQSCATVEYILGADKAVLSAEDLATDSLYNTYKYDGLPPGPIGNPGLSAISAVANPESTEYWYFLSPDGKTTIFAETFAEQEANQAKYLK